MPLLTRAVTRAGARFELPGIDTDDPAVARRRAERVAELLATIGDPGVWALSKVTVTEAGSGRLVFAARIATRPGAKGGGR